MRELASDRIDHLLERAKFAHVAVISNGDPYVSPLSFVRHEDSLYFRCAPGERVDALAAYPRASVSVVDFDPDTGGWESVLVRGDVTFIEGELTEDAVVVLFLEKYKGYMPELGSGARLLEEDDAGIGWVGAPEVPRGEAVLFRLSMGEVTGRVSGRWKTPETKPGRL